MTPCSVCRLPEHKDTSCVDALESVLAALFKNILTDGVAELVNPTIQVLRQEIRSFLNRMGSGGQCRGCGSMVIWVKHANGKNAPYDPTGINHFITCKKAKEFKRK